MAGFPLEPDADALDELTRAVAAFAREEVLSLADQPASDLDGAEAVARSFVEPAPEQGRDLGAILERLRPAVRKSFTASGPGYLAFIPGGGIYSAALADFVACAINRYVGVRHPAPALAQIEETAVRWMADLMGYPQTSRGVLTSGGSLSTLVAFTTARLARLPEDFLRATLYWSEETHHCAIKAARLAGFPARNIRTLPVDARLRLEPDALERAIDADRRAGLTPFLVLANLGTTNTGAIDPLPRVLEIARREGLWVHGDAAYGGFFRLTRDGPRLTAGIDECDSITLDPHKGLFLPFGTGCLLVRDGEALRRAHATPGAGYLEDVETALSFADLSPELSRDFRGLRLWLPIQLHGLRAFREQLEEKLALTREAYDELRADPHFEMLDEPQLTVAAFRLRPRPHETAEATDARSAELLRRVNARQRVLLSGTRIAGRHVLRLCILSFRTHRDRVRDAVVGLREEAAALD